MPGNKTIARLGASPDAPFPPVSAALPDPDGLLAWDGDLEPQRLLRAYRAGIFPWYTGDTILWWCPQRRCVLPTDAVRVSRRLARTLRQQRFRLSCDTAFDAVVAACARREETWITADMARAYGRLHALGHAHSIEAWSGEALAGGLYGVSLGRVFFGESMFSAGRDASKVVLVSLCRVLAHWHYPWLDCQLENPHLQRMGARCVTRKEFLAHLDACAGDRQGRPPGSWTQDFARALELLAPPG